MRLPVLSLQSESYSATGNLAAEGFRKLLGTPGLGLLQTVVREATQNCCDAARAGLGPEIHFRLRRLPEHQLAVMRQSVFRSLPNPESSEGPFRNFLEQDGPWVLEISDFNTIGLAGPTRADRIPAGNDATDYIDFLRNVGSQRDTDQGGGTYGYGKTALYLSSRCAAILVDSQTTFLGNNVRRLLGCHLGSAHNVMSLDGSAERRTGRHWWGVISDGDPVADPAENSQAAALADGIGFLPRSPERLGTSIMIVDPIFLGPNGQEPETVMGMIAESLLWYFWPRLMEDCDPQKKINIHLELDGQHFPLPAPEAFPPLDNFTAAMREVRSGNSGAEEVRSQKPKKLLGHMAVRKGIKSPRTHLVPKKESIIPETSSHIAVMRPVELVVRYFEDEPLPDPRVEWAGVFVADRDHEVESAFAASEPPAHDDWQPKILPKGDQRTYVSVAIRRIKERAREVAAPNATEQDASGGGPSMARVSGQFGRFLGSLSGGGAGPKRRGHSSPVARKKNRISVPAFLRLEDRAGTRVAVFETTVHHDGKNSALQAVVQPMLVIDGGAAADGAWATTAPTVISWSAPDGSVLSETDRLTLDGYSGDLQVRIAMPNNYAVTLKASLEDIGGNSK